MNNIKKIRNDNKLTQREFAELCGVSFGYIHQLEKGIRPLSKKVALKIAKVLNITIDEIYGTQSIRHATTVSKSLANLINYFNENDNLFHSNDVIKKDDDAWEHILLILLQKLKNTTHLDNYYILESYFDIWEEIRVIESIFGRIELTGEKLTKVQQDKIERFNIQIDQFIKMIENFKIGDNE